MRIIQIVWIGTETALLGIQNVDFAFRTPARSRIDWSFPRDTLPPFRRIGSRYPPAWM